jgi:PAS domain S-box-containing protein
MPLIDMDQNIIAFISISIDNILDKKVKSSDYLQYLNELNSPLLVFNTNKELLLKNNKYNKLFSNSSDELKNDSDFKLGHGLDNFLNEFVSDNELQNYLNETPIPSNDNTEYQFYFRKINIESETTIIIEPLLKDLLNQPNELKVKMYDIIMHTSPEPMFIYDIENLKFLEVNHAALKLYGYTRDDFLEMDLTDLYAPEDIQTLIESSPNKTISSDFTGPWRHKHKNGSTILVELSKSTLEFDGKRAHFNIVRDVTKFLEDQKLLQKYKAAYENTSDLIVATDEDGFITNANENFLNKLGYEKKDIDQKPMLSLVHDVDRARLNSEIFHSGIKTKISFETKLKTLDKNELPYQINCRPIVKL